jgi:hypothetical protein
MSNADTPSRPGHRGLLALVIVLGVLILVAVGGLIATAVLRGARGPISASGPYSATIAAPGQRIEASAIDGNRILLRLAGPEGGELVVIEAGSGRVLGRIAIATGP